MPQPIIGVHLDLKGVAFKPAYIPALLADLAGQGVNTVLVEYEDIFPFEGIDIAADRGVRWSQATLKKFLEEAGRNQIEVIPLQQCLGHLEYLFCWRRYRKLALDQAYTSVLDPENPKAKALILEMLRQVVEAHPQSRYIHLGMDEAHALAKRYGNDRVIEVFLRHLEELLQALAPSGKKAIIWSDMIENHISQGINLLEKFRDRVVIGTWDYGSTTQPMAMARLSGNHASKAWLDEADNPEAPPVGTGTSFYEDAPPMVKKLLEPYRRGRHFLPMFHADLWTNWGFEVIGTSAARASSHLSILPRYNLLLGNIAAWSQAIQRTSQLGQIASSWARGTSWCPPNFSIDLTWPLIHQLGKTMGAKPKPFWPGVPEKTVDRIVKTLGRCREDWRLEGAIAAEMEALAPKVKEHRYEWDSLALMARTLEFQRRAEAVIMEVDFFTPNHRPIEPEWQRRLRDQRQAINDLDSLRKRVRAHFFKRYHGKAFDEWLGQIFDLPLARLKECQKISRRKTMLARKTYAGR